MAETSTMPIPPTGVPKSDYTKKKYEGNKYSVEGYEYPSDLMGKNSEYGGNYVIFYINVAEDSKMIENKDVRDTQTLNDVDQQIVDSTRIQKAITGLEITKAKAVAFTTAAGAISGKVAGSILNFGSGAVKGAAGGAITGGSIASQASSFTRSQKRLKTAIALHTPNDLSIRYSAGWGEEETFGAQAAYSGAGEVLSAAGNIGKAFIGTEGALGAAGANLKNTSGIVAAATMKNVPGANMLGIASGLAPNPKKEQMFSGVDFRTFTFNYKFAPRSSVEAKNVLNIINTFKYHMHPEYKDTKGFLFLYPSEFDIVYYHGSEENMNIHRHTSCVLTDMNVNYSPNGVFNTFSDGMPTQIDVQLTFKELTILTKELIKDGL